MTRLNPFMLPARLMGLVIVAAVLCGPVQAQSVEVDATSFMKRMEAMEARLNSVESRRSTVASNIGGAAAAGGVDRRMEEIEQESSQLRGANDRAVQAIEKLAKRLDDYAKDMDMRMGDLEARLDDLAEKGGMATAVPAAGATAVTPEPVATPVAVSRTTAVSATQAKPATAAIPAGMSASDHYNKAYAYLTATDYKNAQAWFEEFLKRHSGDALADNAYYWLGEVYLVQNNPSAAVTKFRDGIKAFPKGSKVTANLFKMGVALEQLKQPKLARAAWEKLLKDYPTAPEAARTKDKLIQLKTAGN